jgi:hypothetical protein
MERFAPKLNMPERQNVPLPTQSSIIQKSFGVIFPKAFEPGEDERGRSRNGN